MLLLLACTTPTTGNPSLRDDFVGDLSVTVVKPEPLEPELVGLGLVGLSLVESDGVAVLAATDELDAYDLVMVLPDYDGPGTYVPGLVRYRKGQQHLLDDRADCEVEVLESGGSFWCEGLHEEGDEADWALQEGRFSDEARPVVRTRSERFLGDGFRFGLQVGELSWEDPGVVMVPFQGQQTWLLADDGGDGHPDEVRYTLTPDVGRLTVAKLARGQHAEGVETVLSVSAEVEIEVAVLDGEVQTGTELDFVLWEDLADGPDEQVLTIK